MERQREEVRQNIREKVKILIFCLLKKDKTTIKIGLSGHNCSMDLIIFCLFMSWNDKKHAIFSLNLKSLTMLMTKILHVTKNQENSQSVKIDYSLLLKNPIIWLSEYS
jgi:hypothetical protein